MEEPMLQSLVQFGVAGLVAWMWLAERRSATERDRQLTEAHQRAMEQRVELDALVRVVTENTRAVASLEGAQRSLNLWVRMAVGLRPTREDASPGAASGSPVPTGTASGSGAGLGSTDLGAIGDRAA